MNDAELNAKLKRLPVPEPDAVARSRALSRALIALRNSEAGEGTVATPQPRRAFGFIASLAGGCGVVVALLMLLGLEQGQLHRADSAADMKVLGEMSAIFPQQLEAVVETNGRVEVLLSQAASRPSGQPVKIEFTRDGEAARILSYSGREVCLVLGGERVCFDILTTGAGGIVVVGRDFLWNEENPTTVAGYHIKASILSPAS